VIADRFTMALLLSVMNCQRGIKAITTTMLNSVIGELDVNCKPFFQAGQFAIQGFVWMPVKPLFLVLMNQLVASAIVFEMRFLLTLAKIGLFHL
jgi:chloramphenicol O-acetyltransferase